VTNVSLPATVSVMGTGSVSGASQGDVDDKVASYMTLKSPGPFCGPPSRASRRSVSHQSVHSVPGDPLVELMSRMVENSRQETLRREQEAKEEILRREQEMERREQEARDETKMREQVLRKGKRKCAAKMNKGNMICAIRLKLKWKTGISMKNLLPPRRKKKKELIALREKQEVEKLALCEKQQAEKLISEKLFELEKQKIELERQKTASVVRQ